MNCTHPTFEAEVVVHRLAPAAGMEAQGLSAGIRLKCSACGEQLRFGGLPTGDNPHGPRISYDGHEARIPVLPGWPKIMRLGAISEADLARGDAMETPE